MAGLLVLGVVPGRATAVIACGDHVRLNDGRTGVVVAEWSINGAQRLIVRFRSWRCGACQELRYDQQMIDASDVAG